MTVFLRCAYPLAPLLVTLAAGAGCVQDGELLRAKTPPSPPADGWSSMWIGNSFEPSVNAWVSFAVGGVYVAKDGTIFTNAQFDYGGRELNIYRGGKLIGFSRDISALGGGTGAITCDDTFCYHSIGRYTSRPNRPSQGFRRIRRDGSTLAGAREHYLTDGDHSVAALARSGSHLFVSDESSQHIRKFDVDTMNEVGNWPLTRPGALAEDGNGGLWAISREAPPAEVARVHHFSASGIGLEPAKDMDVGQSPRALARHSDGSLWLADAGLAQAIYRIDVSAAAASGLVLTEQMGATRGIFNPAVGIGKAGALRFHDPIGLGIDGVGNATVASVGGGSIIETYSRQGVLRERLTGNTRVSGAAFDPGSDEDVYTLNQRFRLDYDEPARSGWKYEAFTLDAKRFPNDPRLHMGPDWEAPWMRRLNGRKFQFQPAEDGHMLAVYRFDDAEASEIAIPAAVFASRRLDWLATQPQGSGGWVWQDQDGDGDFDADEFSAWNSGNVAINAWWPDDAGHVWVARGSGGTERVPLRQVADDGRVTYDLAAATVMPPPAPLTEARRVIYDTRLDLLVVAGSSAAHPRPDDFKSIGSEVRLYEGHAQGAIKELAQLALPDATPMSNDVLLSLDMAGGLVFAAARDASHICRVFDSRTGREVKHIVQGAEAGFAGSPLITRRGMAAHQRRNGEYIISRPDQNHGRLQIVRFLPPPAR